MPGVALVCESVLVIERSVLHLPRPLALTMAWIWLAEIALLKISTSSMRPAKFSITDVGLTVPITVLTAESIGPMAVMLSAGLLATIAPST